MIWPPGRRRSTADPAAVAKLMRRLRKHLATHYRRGVVSRRALAAHLGVDERAVRLWLEGRWMPAEEYVERIEEWIKSCT